MMDINDMSRTPKTARVLVFVLVLCYVLSPLQQTLSYSAHNISHAFSKVQAEQHTHDTLMQSKMGRRGMAHHHHNSHSHTVLSFFNTLLDGDQSSHQNTNTTEIAFDKHFSDNEAITFNSFTILQTHQFFYNSVYNGNLIMLDSPPPEHLS